MRRIYEECGGSNNPMEIPETALLVAIQDAMFVHSSAVSQLCFQSLPFELAAANKARFTVRLERAALDDFNIAIERAKMVYVLCKANAIG